MILPNGFHYRFDDFSLLPDEKLLMRGNDLVPISLRTFEVLHLLVKKEGKVVLKQEFLDEVWANSFVEEGNLAVAINGLRKVLNKKYIETYPKRGYRFNAQVEIVTVNYFTEKLKQPNFLPNASQPSNTEQSAVAQPEALPKKSFLFFLSSMKRRRWLLFLLFFCISSFSFLAIALPEKNKIYASPHPHSISQKPSIAVLPFVDLKPGSETKDLSLRFADYLKYGLSQNDEFTVVSSIPVDKYFQHIPNPEELEKEIDSDYAVTSTFVKNGKTVEISSQLVEVKTGKVILETKDYFANENSAGLKQEISTKLVSKIKLFSNQFTATLNVR